MLGWLARRLPSHRRQLGLQQGRRDLLAEAPHDEADYLDGMDAMFVGNYAIDRKPTLLLVCLALGTWIAGIQLASALRMLAASGRRPLTRLHAGAEPGRGGGDLRPLRTALRAGTLADESVEREPDRGAPGPSRAATAAGEHVVRRRRRVLFGSVSRKGGCSLRTPRGRSVLRLDRLRLGRRGRIGVETRETIALRKHFYHRPRCPRNIRRRRPPMLLAAVPAPTGSSER